MSKIPRSQLAANALQRAIDEGTAQLQAELAAEKQEVERLKGLLSRIAATATEAAGAPAITASSALVAKPAAPPLHTLPPELQAHLKPRAPEPEPEPANLLPLADEDDMGEGHWV